MKHGSIPEYPECKDLPEDMVRRRGSHCDKIAIRLSVPDWLNELGEREFGGEWTPMIKALNEPADVFLRANSLKVSAEDLKAKLATEEILADTVPGLPDALRLEERRNIFTSAAFKEGLFELQDGASQKVAPFLQVAPGMKVVDACAGAGGKALHMGALMKNKGRIIAMDVHQRKLDELRRRAGRNGVDNIETRLIEGPKSIKKYLGIADRVLLDVPCSGLGVLRRNPDAKWKLSLAEIERLQELQQTLLRDYCRIVKPGGKLVYATCSILPAENERQIQAFLADHGEEWRLEEEMTLWPHRDGFDGFYAARLLRLPKEGKAAPTLEEAPAQEEVSVTRRTPLYDDAFPSPTHQRLAFRPQAAVEMVVWSARQGRPGRGLDVHELRLRIAGNGAEARSCG